MAEWLCNGLQIREQRFDSASGLHHRKKLKDPAIPPRAAYLPRYAHPHTPPPNRSRPGSSMLRPSTPPKVRLSLTKVLIDLGRPAKAETRKPQKSEPGSSGPGIVARLGREGYRLGLEQSHMPGLRLLDPPGRYCSPHRPCLRARSLEASIAAAGSRAL